MTRPSLRWFPGLALLLILTGCAEAPVKIGDGRIEKPLSAVTGLTTADVQRASQKGVLDLWDVYALAVERTEKLASSHENVIQAQAENSQAIGAWLPQVSLNDTKSGQSTNYIVGAYNPLFQPSDNSLYLSGSETILSGLTQVAALKGAGANIDAQRYNLRDQARLLLLGVAKDFYNVLTLEETLKAQEASRDLNEKTLSIEKKWQRMGRSRLADVSNTRAQLSQLLADIESTKNQLVQAREDLATLADIPSDQALAASDESYAVPTDSLEQAEARAARRPDVKSAAASVVVADAQLLQAHGQHLPSLVLQGQYYLSKNGGSPTPDWLVQLTASLPLFAGGQVVAQENAAASKKRQAEMQLTLARRTAADDVRQAYKSLVESVGETDAYQKAVEDYQAAYQDVLHDYKLNLTTNLELLQTMTSLENTRINYVKAKYQTLYDQVWLGAATGDLPKTGKSNSKF